MSLAVRWQQRRWTALLWLFYLSILLVTALPRGMHTPIPDSIQNVEPFTLWAKTDEWIRAFGPQDPASYARAGQEIVTTGWVKTPFYETAWPPGMYLLHAMLLQFQLPVPVSLIFLSCCLWAGVFVQVYCFARRRLHPLAAAAVPLATLATELMRHFFLRGKGPYISEGFSCPLQILGFGFLVLALEPLAWPIPSRSGDFRRMLWAGGWAGVCLALAAYVRALTEVSLMFLTLAFLLLMLVSFVVAIWRARFQPQHFYQSLRGWWRQAGLVPLFVVLASFHAFTLPYRLLHNYRGHGYLEWTTGYSYVWTMMWRDPATFTPEGRFYVEGGGSAPAILAADWHIEAAKITPEQGRSLALRLLRTRPVSWFSYKLPLLWQYWQSRNRAVCTPLGHAYLENGILLFLLLVPAAGCLICVIRRRAAGTALGVGLFTAAIVATIAPALIFHLESRYLHPVKVFSLFLMPYCLVLTRRGSETTVRGDGSVLPEVSPTCTDRTRS